MWQHRIRQRDERKCCHPILIIFHCVKVHRLGHCRPVSVGELGGERDSKLVDGVEPAGDPLEVGGGVGDLGLDELPVGDGVVVDPAVGVGDAGEVADGGGEVFFLLIVLLP